MRTILLGAGGSAAERSAEMAELLALSGRAVSTLRDPFEREVSRSVQATEERAGRGGSAANVDAGLVQFFDITATVVVIGGNTVGLHGANARGTGLRRINDGGFRDIRGANGT